MPYKRGDRLTMDGRPGTLVSFPGARLGIRFDGDKFTSPCHPTWRIERENPGQDSEGQPDPAAAYGPE